MSEGKSVWRRSRQSNEDGGRQNRHVVKLTDEQELAAQARAKVAGVTHIAAVSPRKERAVPFTRPLSSAERW